MAADVDDRARACAAFGAPAAYTTRPIGRGRRRRRTVIVVVVVIITVVVADAVSAGAVCSTGGVGI